MITDPKTLGDMGFNFAMCAAFAVPAVGPILAAGISGMQQVFDILIGGGQPVKLSQTLATYGELESEMQATVQHIDASIWTSVKTQYFTDFELDMDAYNLTIGQAEAQQGSTRTDKIAADVLQSQWDTSFGAAREPMDPHKSSMLRLTTWLGNYPAQQQDTLSLYQAAAGLYLNYCKLNMLIDCNLMYRKYLFAADQYHVDLAQFQTQHQQWQSADPATRGPEPVKPSTLTAPEQNFLNLLDSDAADNVRYYVKEFITYADPIVATMEQGIAARDLGVAQRIAQVVQKSDVNGNYWWEDAADGTSGTKTTDKSMADAYLQMQQGQARAQTWQALTDQYNLANVVPAQLTQARDIVTYWQTCQTSFAVPTS